MRVHVIRACCLCCVLRELVCLVVATLCVHRLAEDRGDGGEVALLLERFELLVRRSQPALGEGRLALPQGNQREVDGEEPD